MRRRGFVFALADGGGIESAQAFGKRGEVVRQPVEQLLLAQ